MRKESRERNGPHVNPVTFRRTVLTLFQYWREHGVDWVPTQTWLEEYCLETKRLGINIRTFWRVLHGLVARGVLERFGKGPKTVLYRLARGYAEPTWPRFHAELDEALDDPIPWVERDGRVFLIGRPTGRRPFVARVPTNRPHLAAFLWWRAMIHLLNHGAFQDPKAALRMAIEAIHQTVLAFTWACCQNPGFSPLDGRVYEAWRRSRAWSRANQFQHFGANQPDDPAYTIRTAGDALEIIEAAIGTGTDGSSRASVRRQAYEDLDALVFSALQNKMVDAPSWTPPPCPQFPSGTPTRPNPDRERTDRRLVFAPLNMVEPLIRLLPDQARRLFAQDDHPWGPKVEYRW